MNTDDFPIDPHLPYGFNDTPNDERPKSQVEEWWDRPYGLTTPDGRIEVRCLDGGAWDRPTWYGVAEDVEAARLLARSKLLEWRRRRLDVSTCISDRDHKVVRFPQRPGEEMLVLYQGKDSNDASAWLKRFRSLDCPADPQ